MVNIVIWKFGKPGSGFVGTLLLSGVLTTAWDSGSLFVRAELSRDNDASLFSNCFGACGDLSGFDLGSDVGGASGEQLSTALEFC
jgi:hypothetical protein